MALRQAASTIPVIKPGPKCGVWKLLKYLDADDQAWLVEQCAGSETSVWISAVLREDGHDISEFTVQRHRRGKCSCASQ